MFFAVWAGGVLFFSFSIWAGGMLFFCCLGGVVLWAGGVFMFLLFWRVACFSLLFGRGTGVHSLTGLPSSSLSDPTTKKDQTAKKENTGSRILGGEGVWDTESSV